MNDWWKSPVLQGPENDYGEYDYMIEEIPQDSAEWELSKDKWKCDECGKESRLRFVAVQYFHTLDGYDSMSHVECWRCCLKDTIHSYKWKAKKQIKIIKAALKLHSMDKNLGLRKCYEFAKEIER